MSKKLFGLCALISFAVFAAGCNSGSSASMNSSADKATKEARDAKDKAEKELREKESTEKSRAEKEMKDKESTDKLGSARAVEAAALVKAKEEITKLFDLPKVEAVIGTLPADKKIVAQSKLDDFKKLWNEFMKEENANKLNDWKDRLKTSFGELSKSAGL